jgi:putative ATPase
MYWLARMLAAGEDARYIARRLVILASEDVGLADSNGLVVADAAARAVEFVGLPEAALNLAHATLYLATAPKSNTTAAALLRVNRALRTKPEGAVPIDLKQQHPYQRNKLKEGREYRYPHNDPSGFVAQSYRPPEVEDDVYYRPSPHGDEAAIAARLLEWWGEQRYDGEQWYEFEKFTSSDPER